MPQAIPTGPNSWAPLPRAPITGATRRLRCSGIRCDDTRSQLDTADDEVRRVRDEQVPGPVGADALWAVHLCAGSLAFVAGEPGRSVSGDSVDVSGE